MSKARPSPRRGGRRVKHTLSPAYEDSPQVPIKSQPKTKTMPKVGRNVTPPVKKPAKPTQSKGGKRTSDGKGKGGGKGKKQSLDKSASEKDDSQMENDLDRDELEQEINEMNPLEVKSDPKKKAAVRIVPAEDEASRTDEDFEDEEYDEKSLRMDDEMDDSNVNHSVGEELMECLSKSGRKKKAMRMCSNCGVQSPVSRAKKCPSCGQNLFSKSSGCSQEITCPKCDFQQRFSGTLATAFCSRCNTLLTKKYKEKDTSPDGGTQNGSIQEADDIGKCEEDNTVVSDDKVAASQHDDLPCPRNTDGSFQMGYSSNTVHGGGCKPSENTESDPPTPPSNETSQETLRRIIKKRILGDIDQSDPPSKKPCKDEVESVETSMSNFPDDKSTGTKEPLSLNIPPPPAFNTHTSAVSSPLMEYAQKISARLFIPPEIPPQEASRRGRSRASNTRTGKSHLGRNKRFTKDSNLDTQHPSSPGSPPDHSLSLPSRESALHEALPLPPPLVKSNDDGFHKSSDTPEQVMDFSSSSSAIPPLITTTKSFHDPTINSIRRTITPTPANSSNKSTFYSTPSSTPPSVNPSSSSLYSSSLEPEGRSTVNNAQVVSKNLYPEHRTSSVPPLLAVEQDEENMVLSHGVAHTTVIVDPRNDTDCKDSSAPPALVMFVDSPPATKLEPHYLPDNNIDDQVSLSQAQLPAGQPVTGGVGVECSSNNDPVKGIDGSWLVDCTHKVKHSKRKQSLHLVNTSPQDDGIIYEPTIIKKKKKKKKKEKDKERSEKGHHSKSKGDKDLERKARKKLKKEKRREKENEELCSINDGDEMLEGSQEEVEEVVSQCAVVENKDTVEQKEDTSVLYTVKIKDCIIHQIRWGEFLMVLLVPQPPRLNVKEKEATPIPYSERATTPTDSIVTDMDYVMSGKRRLRSSQKKHKDEEMAEEGDSLVEPESPREAKKKKKKQIRIKSELEAYPDPPESSTTENYADAETFADPSSLPPSFSIFELRNKIFSEFPPRAVHAFTYKMKIRTHRPALYWIHILKRIGGLPETCHMCRLLDVESLKQLCALHKVDVPECIDNLICPRPNLKGRKVIDLSDQDPCSFLLNPEVLHHSLPHSTFQGAKQKPSLKSEPTQQQADMMLPKRECRKRKTYSEQDEEEEMETEEDTGEFIEKEDQPQPQKSKKKKIAKSTTVASSKNAKQSPPNIKSNPASPGSDHIYLHKHAGGGGGGGGGGATAAAAGTGKKKPCPNCGYNMLRKSKKCVNCGKPFGVFTFGRRQCTYCDHINLARMSACFKCGQSLEKAPTAVPKISEIFDGPVAEHRDTSPVVKHDFKFGVKRKRKLQSVPSSPPSNSQTKHHQHHQQHHHHHHPHPHHDVTYDSADEVFNDDCDVSSPLTADKRKRGEGHHSGYRYGKIPWNDADLALIVTSTGTPKLCLQEVCTKVLRFHQKLDVFELVKNLNLQLEAGDSNLLKKLQALGLHPNRSPMCRLIASEDLFALMDALEELVPDEVHQYLGNVGSNSAMEVSDSVLLSHGSSSPSSNTPVLSKPITFTVGDDQEHGFESTLHEIECSDGHLLAMLRSWEGDHYLCLLEVWRRYFPEVNRSNLSATIKRLDIETKIPTSQQTNLLRAAGIISVRGAPGRLVKIEDIQKLLSDFGIVLTIGVDTAKDNKEKKDVGHFPMYRGLNSNKAVCHAKKFTPHSKEPSEMESILLSSEEKYLKQLKEIESSTQGQATQENILHNHILGRRELCTALTDEIAFLTVTNHSMMAELVHTSYTLRQILNEIDDMIDPSQIVKKS